MLHEQTLSQYFTINRELKRWVSLETLNGEPLLGFKPDEWLKSLTESAYISQLERQRRGGTQD